MAAEWYFRVMGAEFGPVSATELVEQAADGKIRPDTEVRKGEGAWIPASRVAGLFDRASHGKGNHRQDSRASAPSQRRCQRVRPRTVPFHPLVEQNRSPRRRLRTTGSRSRY